MQNQLEQDQMQIQATHFEIKDNLYALYHFKITQNQKSWCFSIRYSDLRELHGKLIMRLKLVLPKFPEKQNYLDFSSQKTNPIQVEKRKNELEDYMIALINNDIVRNSDIFQDFIQITKPPGFDEQYEYDRSKILRYHQNLIYQKNLLIQNELDDYEIPSQQIQSKETSFHNSLQNHEFIEKRSISLFERKQSIKKDKSLLHTIDENTKTQQKEFPPTQLNHYLISRVGKEKKSSHGLFSYFMCFNYNE